MSNTPCKKVEKYKIAHCQRLCNYKKLKEKIQIVIDKKQMRNASLIDIFDF